MRFRITLLLALLGSVAGADTTVPINGNNYTVTDHPRVWLDGPSGTFTTAIKDPDGAGPLVAPKATDDNPAYVALKNRIRTCVASNPPCSIISGLGGQNYYPVDQLADAALDWYMDNSQTNSLRAAKYWINNIETIVNPGFQFGCDVDENYCGVNAWVDWPSNFMYDYALAYTLVRDQLSTGEKTTFAQKIWNDVTYTEEDACTNQLQRQVGALATFVSGSTSITGSGFTGLTAGRTIYIKAAAPSIAEGGWAVISTVNSDSSLTLVAPPVSSLAAVKGSITSGRIYELKPWSSTTCGLAWQVLHHTYNPRGRTVPTVTTTLGSTITNSQTTMTVASQSGFPPSTPYILNLGGSELVQVTNVNGATLTITRGYHGTTPAALFSGKNVYYSKYAPQIGNVEFSHNIIVQKLIGYLSLGLAMADDSATAKDFADRAASDWLLLTYPANKDMWTGLQQGGSTSYGTGRHLDANLGIVWMLKQFTGTPSLDKSAGNWLKNPVYLYLYSLVPTSTTDFMPWGQPDLSTHPRLADSYWELFQGAIFGTSLTEYRYYNYWQRVIANQFTSSNIGTSPNYNAIPWLVIFSDTTDPSTDYRSVLPLQRVFNSVDGNPQYALAGWFSRTGWSTSTDTLTYAASYALHYTVDHIGSGAPGAYKIYKNGWTLGENGSNDMGVGVDTNMPVFGATASLQSNQAISIDRTQSDASTSAYSFVRINAQPAYSSATGVSRALRYLAHMKKSGTQDYVIAYDDLVSSAKTKTVNLYFDKSSGESSSMTSSTLPSLVWTGPNRRISSTVVLPTTGSVFGTYSSLTNSHKVAVCASLDGTTCDSTNGSAEFLVVHRPSTDVADAMPTVGLLSSDAGYRVVQVQGTYPKVVAFPKAGASSTSVAFTTTHSGTAQVLVLGVTPGSYLFKRNGSTVCSAQTVDANGALYCESLSGSITVVDSGAPPVDPVIIDSAPLTNGTVGTAYSHTFTSTGGTGSGKVWTQPSGTLPAGLSLASNGALTGTPTTSGPYTFTIQVVDSGSNTAGPTQFTLTIDSAAGSIALTGTADAAATYATLFFGGPGLAAGASCAGTVTLGGVTVATFTDTGALARRKQTVIGLQASSGYQARIDCTGAQTLNFAFSTPAVASCPAGSIQFNLKASFKPPAGLTGASKVFVEYGYNAVTDNSKTLTSCGSGCSGTIFGGGGSGIQNGPLLMRHTWQDVNGTALTPPSATRTVLLQSDCPQAPE